MSHGRFPAAFDLHARVASRIFGPAARARHQNSEDQLNMLNGPALDRTDRWVPLQTESSDSD